MERTIIKAIKNDVSIFAMHTNLDNIKQGVNQKLGALLNLQQPEILSPKPGKLMKLVTFVPQEYTYRVLDALHKAGAGVIGEYDHCSFRVQGTGRFKPSEKATPHTGKKNTLEEVKEDRLEVIFPVSKKDSVIKALSKSHPYEEVAYYLHDLANLYQESGSGMIGNLTNKLKPEEFLEFLKKSLRLNFL